LGGNLGFKSDLVSDFNELKSNLDNNISIDAASYPISQANTDYNIGISEAINSLDSSSRNSSTIIIFLSHGQHNAIEPPLPYESNSALDYAKRKGYKLFATGLNISSDSDADKLLRAIADSTGGKYFFLIPFCSKSGRNF
jgi:hypothetical protein